ncbi:MAG TPA: response regulator [Alphaproteobacteria bacterium]|nr:response regulator [Alphaproteobacteria bacterium]
MGSKVNGSDSPQDSAQAALHVLVADDNAMNQDLTVRMLSRAGHTADVVNDGTAALEALAGMAYDVVLVDMMMPGLSGLDVIRRYRETGGDVGRTPFIVLTANATQEAAELARDAGAAAYLTKPIQPKTLRTTIEQVVSQVQVAEPDLPAGETGLAMATGGQALIAEDVFEETLGLIGDVERARGFIDRFCGDTERLIGQIDSAIGEGRLAEVRDLAHAIKGSAAYLGAKRMVAASEYLQRASVPDLQANGSQALDRLQGVYRETRDALLTRLA